MSATERLCTERDFHDRQAMDRAITFQRQPERLWVDEETYLNHETWIRPAIERLYPLDGRRVLDYGCGHGMAAVVFARREARVTALDISPGYLSEVRARARANAVDISLVQATGERLPFVDGAFERVWGNAILHHLDIETAARELFRVLSPGGIAVLCEPWGGNRLANLARRAIPSGGVRHTPDEAPLDGRHVEQLQHVFGSVDVQGFQLLGMARRMIGNVRALKGLDWCDRMLLARAPRLEQFCRYVVITLRR